MVLVGIRGLVRLSQVFQPSDDSDRRQKPALDFRPVLKLISRLDHVPSAPRMVLGYLTFSCSLFFFKICLLFIYFVYFWLHWVLVEARGLLSSCGVRVFSSLVLARRFQGTWALVEVCEFSSCGTRAYLPRSMSDLSCLTRDRTRVPCIVRWILYHWTTREVPLFMWS